MTEELEQLICIKICIKLENIPPWSSQLGQLVIGSFITTMYPLLYHVSCRVFGTTSSHPGDSAPYSLSLASYDFWLFLRLKLHLKGKRFQTVNETQGNRMGQLMVSRRTVWGPKVPTLKGAEASFVLCTIYLVSSSINVSIFHITWLDTFRTDLVYLK